MNLAAGVAGVLGQIGGGSIFKLTPLHLQIIVHYNSSPDDIENMEAPAVRQYIAYLTHHGILQQNTLNGSRPNSVTRTYELSRKGQAYLEALLSVPFPEQTYKVRWPQRTNWDGEPEF